MPEFLYFKTCKPMYVQKTLWYFGFFIILIASFTLLKNTLKTDSFLSHLEVGKSLKNSLFQGNSVNLDSFKSLKNHALLEKGKGLSTYSPITERQAEQKIELLQQLRLHNILRKSNQEPIVSVQNSINSKTSEPASKQNINENETTRNIKPLQNLKFSNIESLNLHRFESKINQASDKTVIQQRILEWERELK